MALNVPRKSAAARPRRAQAAKLQAGRQAAPAAQYRLRSLPWSPGIQPTWTASQIRSALRQHEQGFFSDSAKLVEAMGRDDRVLPVLGTRTRGLLGFPFRVAPPDEDDRQMVEFAGEWEELWPRAVPFAVASKLLADLVMMGVAVGQVYWERYRGLWEPRLVNEHPGFLQWDDVAMRYTYQTRDGVVDVVPGDGKWVVLEAGERGYMNGAVRALGLLWLIRSTTWLDWSRYNERHGMPILKAKFPTQARNDAVDGFWDDVVELGRETSLLLPQGIGPNGEGFDVDLLEASDRSWPSFQELQRQANASIAIYLLGQNLTTEVTDKGARSAVDAHEAVKQQIFQADERELGDDLLEQFVRPASALMRPGGADLAGRPSWDTTPPADRKADAEATLTAASALKTFADAGYRVKNVEEFAAEFGVELELAPPKPAPPPPAFLAPPGGQARPLPEAGEPEPPSRQPGLPSVPEGDEPDDPDMEEARAVVPGLQRLAAGTEDDADYDARLAANAGADSGGKLLRELVAAIDASESFEQLRREVVRIYAGHDDEQVAAVLESAFRLAELSGIYAAEREARGEA